MRPRPPLCVALDTSDLGAAERLVGDLAGLVGVFKVGLELFTAAGPHACAMVRRAGAEVFLDLKVNDIPNQAAGAVRAATAHDVAYLTVHANGGRRMLRAARDAAADAGPALLAVSVLTSLDDAALGELGVGRTAAEQVDALATVAAEEGIDGLVLSAEEVGRVRAAHPNALLVTPGIRPAGADVSDQRRVGTPAGAVAAGSDLLVVGRPITEAPDPVRATEAVLAEIATTVER